MRAFAAGGPVTIESLATVLGWPPDRVRRILHALPFTRWDAADHLVGLFLSCCPSPSHVRIRGRGAYCQNPLDGLIAASLLDAPIRITSSCALTGVPILIEISSPAGHMHLTPPTAVISVVPPAGTPYRLAPLMDANQLLFRDSDTAQVWLRKHQDCIVLTAHEAYQYAQKIAEIY